MENNKTNTQVVETPDTTNNEVKGGKTFSQEDVNKIVASRLEEEKTKTKQAISKAVQEAVAEERRQAKLTEEERENEAKSKREKELKEREDSITLRERKLEAQEMLREKNIPINLVDFVIDLDETKTKENVEKLAKTYNKSVETGITDKLKGNPPKDFSNSNNNNDKTDKKKEIVSAF